MTYHTELTAYTTKALTKTTTILEGISPEGIEAQAKLLRVKDTDLLLARAADIGNLIAESIHPDSDYRDRASAMQKLGRIIAHQVLDMIEQEFAIGWVDQADVDYSDEIEAAHWDGVIRRRKEQEVA